MMAVNLANCFKKLGMLNDSEEALKLFDWTASADEYKISVAALKGDIDIVCNLIARVADDTVVGKAGLRDWPVFDWVRDNERVKEKFKEIFGEPLQIADKAQRESGIIDDKENSAESGDQIISSSGSVAIH